MQPLYLWSLTLMVTVKCRSRSLKTIGWPTCATRACSVEASSVDKQRLRNSFKSSRLAAFDACNRAPLLRLAVSLLNLAGEGSINGSLPHEHAAALLGSLSFICSHLSQSASIVQSRKHLSQKAPSLRATCYDSTIYHQAQRKFTFLRLEAVR
jgi:hypothetical protein